MSYGTFVAIRRTPHRGEVLDHATHIKCPQHIHGDIEGGNIRGTIVGLGRIN